MPIISPIQCICCLLYTSQKVEVSLEKAMETNELFGIGNNGEIKNISFGLFADEELVSARCV